MIRWIRNLIVVQEKRPFSAENIVFFALFVGSMRLLMEVFLVGFNPSHILRNELVYVSWYFMCFFVFGIPVRILAPPPWEKRINVMLVGLFLGFIPPIIDVLIRGWGNAILGLDGFAYMYVKTFPEGWPWLMIDHERQLPIGEGSVLWAAVFFTGIYVGLRTQSVTRAALGLITSYVACVFVGAIMPTLSYQLHLNLLDEDMHLSWTVIFAQLFVAGVAYFAVYRPSLLLLVCKRFVHALPLIGLTLVGYSWIKKLDINAIYPVLVLALCGVLTIVQNDHWDDVEERPNEPERVRRHDVVVTQFLWMLMAAALLAMDSVIGVILTIYGVASYLYNAPLYRGKRYFPANLKLEGLWGGSAFLVGVFSAALPQMAEAAANLSFVERADPTVRYMPFALVYSGDVALASFLAFGGWSLLAVLKDEKDITIDASLGTQTVFTLLTRRGVSVVKIRRWTRALTFIALMIAALGALAVGRVTFVHSAALGALALLISLLRLNDKKNEFRLILIGMTTFLLVLAHGVSSAHP